MKPVPWLMVAFLVGVAQRVAVAGFCNNPTDNGSSFVAKRFGAYLKDRFSHVRIEYRTPTQLGLLQRFHRTLKAEAARLWTEPGAPRRRLPTALGQRFALPTCPQFQQRFDQQQQQKGGGEPPEGCLAIKQRHGSRSTHTKRR